MLLSACNGQNSEEQITVVCGLCELLKGDIFKSEAKKS